MAFIYPAIGGNRGNASARGSKLVVEVLRTRAISISGTYRYGSLGAFFIRWLDKKDEKRRNLVLHYKKLKDHIFSPWKRLEFQKAHEFDGVRAQAPLYLVSWKGLFNESHTGLLDWALEHVKSKNGYPELASLFDKLKEFEEKHNKNVSRFVVEADASVQRIISTFPHLSDWQHGKSKNYYHLNHIINAVQSPHLSLDVHEDELQLNNSTTLVKSDNRTITDLKTKIEACRIHFENYSEDFTQNDVQDKKLVEDIRKAAGEIIFDIDNFEHLNGKCEFERSVE